MILAEIKVSTMMVIRWQIAVRGNLPSTQMYLFLHSISSGLGMALASRTEIIWVFQLKGENKKELAAFLISLWFQQLESWPWLPDKTLNLGSTPQHQSSRSHVSIMCDSAYLSQAEVKFQDTENVFSYSASSSVYTRYEYTFTNKGNSTKKFFKVQISKTLSTANTSIRIFHWLWGNLVAFSFSDNCIIFFRYIL